MLLAVACILATGPLAGCTRAAATRSAATDPDASPTGPSGAASTGTGGGATPSGTSPSATGTPSAAGGPQGSAAALLAGLPVKGRAALTGYRRELFGQTWADVDRNGCDTRNDILRRDLAAQRIRPGTGGCVVLSGTLADPYGGTAVAFARGGADDVEIDHVVALADAWVTGAQGWTPQRRVAFANDPANLLAVSAGQNRSKGESDAASWLPPNKAFRCGYVARQVTVKAKYGLWVTRAERAALAAVLGSCPGLAAAPAGTQPTESEVGAATSDPDAPVTPGALCSPPGATGRTAAGTAMRCTSTATDPRHRWRRA